MNSILRRSIRPTFRPDSAAWVCRQCCSTRAAPTVAREPEERKGKREGKEKEGEKEKEKKPARTRFAPSPTGFMHLGSLRTALYNYLLAKNTGGQFILRIEDTDMKRTVPGAEENIYETLRWAGLQWDEGPQVGGNYGPYKQSERTALHRAHVEQLLEGGHAYRCFCGPKRLEALASKRQVSGLPVEYDRRCYNLSKTESQSRAASGESHVIRLVAPDEWPSFKDTVYGRISYGENSRAHSEGSFEDPVLLKSDGMPTYHLANVVDDHYMNITHVVRGTEWMPSTPKHMHLYKCFEWNNPQWVHVGLLQNKDRTKLSKRDGSVMVSDYRQRGYTADALNNFVALLGWSHGGHGRSDIMTLEEMVELFDVNGLTTGNTIVNSEKLPFLQKSHIRRKVEASKGSEDEEVAKVEKEVRALYGDTLETGEPITTEYIREILKANVQNYLLPSEFAAKANYFFKHPTFDSESSIRSIVSFRKLTGMSTEELYHGFIEKVEKIPDTPDTWSADNIRALFTYEKELDEEAWTQRLRLLRIALCGGNPGPSVAETMHILGKQRTVARLRNSDAAFESFGGELKDAEKKLQVAHEKLLNEYQAQQKRERLREQGIKWRPSKEKVERAKAGRLAFMPEPPEKSKGYKYMDKGVKARVKEEYRQKVEEIEMKAYKPRRLAGQKELGGNLGKKPQAEDDWN